MNGSRRAGGSRSRGGACAGAARWVVVVIVAIVAIAAAAAAWVIWSGTGSAKAVELEAEVAQVTCGGAGSPKEPLPPGEVARLATGDAIDVDAQGRAQLRFEDYLLVHIFRDSGLELESSVDPDAPPLAAYHLAAGTTFNTMTPESAAERRLTITAGEVVITALGTEFLVHHDASSGATWVVVREGVVSVGANGREVVVREGQQTWVMAGRPPIDPRPATREETGDRFPRVEELTNGAMRDGDVLLLPSEPTPRSSTTEPTNEVPTEPPPALPDLVVSSFQVNGEAAIDEDGNTVVPVLLVVANQGGSPAATFKIAVLVETGDGARTPVAFQVPGQESTWFPFAGPLPPAGQLELQGNVLVPGSVDVESAMLVAEVDSRVGDEFVPDYGRVQESNEDNNRSRHPGDPGGAVLGSEPHGDDGQRPRSGGRDRGLPVHQQAAPGERRPGRRRAAE